MTVNELIEMLEELPPADRDCQIGKYDHFSGEIIYPDIAPYVTRSNRSLGIREPTVFLSY